mmetsp:Transcript_62456/g.179155  ORF Transcript_62456/g.179155 Transcript_62456/m.179155 type:complete len:263 (+) Transcript_62456:454-1242(+)
MHGLGVHARAVAHGCRLEDIEHLPHVSLADPNDGSRSVLRELDTLALRNVVQPPDDLLLRQRCKPQFSAPRLQRRDDLAAVVADQDESRVGSILLNHPPERELGRVGHVVRLVQDDEFRVPRRSPCAEQLLDAHEGLDLISDHVDASGVGGVELQGHTFELLLEHRPRQRDDRGGLARSRRAVQQHVWQLLLYHHPLHHSDDVLVGDQLTQGGWPVLLNPRQLRQFPAEAVPRRRHLRGLRHLHVRHGARAAVWPLAGGRPR